MHPCPSTTQFQIRTTQINDDPPTWSSLPRPPCSPPLTMPTFTATATTPPSSQAEVDAPAVDGRRGGGRAPGPVARRPRMMPHRRGGGKGDTGCEPDHQPRGAAMFPRRSRARGVDDRRGGGDALGPATGPAREDPGRKGDRRRPRTRPRGRGGWEVGRLEGLNCPRERCDGGQVDAWALLSLGPS